MKRIPRRREPTQAMSLPECVEGHLIIWRITNTALRSVTSDLQVNLELAAGAAATGKGMP
jgi:hypothetical protein